MTDYLHISATFLDSCFHGRGDRGEPEWPPSPLRLMQAIVAANADAIGADGPLDRAFEWLEQQPPPLIVAPPTVEGTPYCLSVPNNAMDLVGKAWTKGNYFGTGDSNPATHRTMKTVRPTRMVVGEHDNGNAMVHYLWPLDDAVSSCNVKAILDAARRMIALGWGIDLVAGYAKRTNGAGLHSLGGERWCSTTGTSSTVLRFPIAGTFQALQERHAAFIQRMGDDGFIPVPPLTKFDMIGYRRSTDAVGRPSAVFELRHNDDSFCRYSQRKLIHIAGMTRHRAKTVMQSSPPPGVDADWVERYVVGHRANGETNHRQLSYLPLPSIGHRYADQIIRRVMITAPQGDERSMEQVVSRLAGQQLEPDPEYGADFGDAGPPTLVRVKNDKVARAYTRPSNVWTSVIPVILPGHDDRKPAKTRKLIEKALQQSGIEQPCEFEWSAYSKFPKSFSAHKYDREGRRIGYYRPDHLASQTAVHLTLRFNDGLEVPGPIAIGAGRHCGLGLMAPPPT